MISQEQRAKNIAGAAAYSAAQVLAARVLPITYSECWAQYKGQQAAEQYTIAAGYPVALAVTSGYVYPDEYSDRDTYLRTYSIAFHAAHAAILDNCSDSSMAAGMMVVEQIRSRYVK